MGCIFLEFVIWLIYGKDELVQFTTVSKNGEKPRFYEKFKAEDLVTGAQKLWVPGTEKRETAQVHSTVQNYISKIKESGRCPEGTAVRRLVDLISDKLLVVELGNVKPPPVQTSEQSNQESEEPDQESEELDPDPLTGVPGLRKQSATFSSDTTANSSGSEKYRVYARDMKNELVTILEGLENGSIKPVGDENSKSTLVVQEPSHTRPTKTGGFLNVSVDNRVGQLPWTYVLNYIPVSFMLILFPAAVECEFASQKNPDFSSPSLI
jgi:hypothetical protein